MAKIYRCEQCGYHLLADKTKKGFKSPKYLMGLHYETEHKDLLPDDMDGFRWFYFKLTKKTRGSCYICHNETDFNRKTMKYSRFCNNPACKQKYKETEAQARMIKVYGKLTLLDDPEHQKKMQQGRRIAGWYTWSDGKTKFPYLSSYEMDFLRHLDVDLKWPVSDVFMPSPHVYNYDYNGKSHFYMPDAFIPSMNLEVEIKDDGNARRSEESREKDKIKDELMKSCSQLINYIKIVGKKYDEFDMLISREAT